MLFDRPQFIQSASGLLAVPLLGPRQVPRTIGLGDVDSFCAKFGVVSIHAAIEMDGQRRCIVDVYVKRFFKEMVIVRRLVPSEKLKGLLAEAGVPTEWVPDDLGFASLGGDPPGEPSEVLARIRELVASFTEAELTVDPHPDYWESFVR